MTIERSPEETNRAECKAARDQAIDRVEEHANDTWIDLAYSIVVQLATASMLNFTAEDVWKILETSYPEVKTGDRRAMGAIMRRAKREGIATPTGMYVPSALKNRALWAGPRVEGNRGSVMKRPQARNTLSNEILATVRKYMEPR